MKAWGWGLGCMIIMGCASSTYTEKTDTHTVVIQIDTTVIVDIPVIIDTVTTLEILDDSLEIWVETIETPEGQAPKPEGFKATRNKKTGKTAIEVKPKDQQVDVKATVTTTDQKKETSQETESFLDELKDLWLWLIVGAVVLIIGFLVLKKAIGF